MVFKKTRLFFTSKISRSSDSSSSPRSVDSNSPSGSDKKKHKSSSSPSSSAGVLDGLKKKDGSSKVKEASSGKSNFSPSKKLTAETAILASSLGLKRIKTRSGPLPQENFFDFGDGDKAIHVVPSYKPSKTRYRTRRLLLPPMLPMRTGPSKVSPNGSGTQENPKEPRTDQALLRMTSAPRKRFSNGIKSYSHELNSKVVRPFPLWKSRRPSHAERIVNLFRTKFDKAKKDVNFDLGVFAADLITICEENTESDLELRTIEDLLILAQRCTNATPVDFWFQCEDIVQDLDDRRQELPQGVLKQLHTRLLFILTRCTRLLQFHKASWGQKDKVVQIRQSRVPTGEVRERRGLIDRPSPLSSPYNETSKGAKETAVSKEQKSCISMESSIICRICEEEVPVTHVQDHSRVCALADKYDQKGLSVDQRLVAVAETLERISETFIENDSLAEVESLDGMKASNASLTGESDVLSPKLSDCSPKESEDILDGFAEADNTPFTTTSSPIPSSGSMTPRSPILTPRPDPIELLLGGKGTFHDRDDIPEMVELADIAICATYVIPDRDRAIQLLLSCLDDLRGTVDERKFNALTVQTFGIRIEKLLREKYIQLVYGAKVKPSEYARLEDKIFRSLKTRRRHLRHRVSIDDFEELKEISRGAFGRVILAKKRTTGDLFAIKVLKKADMIRKNAVESILAERDILINVHNPFVVRFFYSFTSRENLYLVMEYLGGGDFYSLLKNMYCLEETSARVYIAEVILALEYLHSVGVVHRDLKPDNLLIANDGHVKLTDFGLSKVGLINHTDDLAGPVLGGESVLLEEKSKLPTSEPDFNRVDKRSAVGTPDYLAPEILLGSGHGATADWWSVGIILFEFLVGVPPFNADHPEKIFDNILNRNIPWPSVPEEMSYEARDLIERLLTEDPNQRLGARGAAEIKQHIFFKDINWDTLAEQKAVFVPDSKDPLDTSYFQSRYPSNNTEEQSLATNENGSSSCLSNDHNERVDERGGPVELETSVSEYTEFDDFSFKNLLELVYFNDREKAKQQVCL